MLAPLAAIGAIHGGEIGYLLEVEIVAAGPQSMHGERPQRAAA
jgi:hypothetical protein